MRRSRIVALERNSSTAATSCRFRPNNSRQSVSIAIPTSSAGCVESNGKWADRAPCSPFDRY